MPYEKFYSSPFSIRLMLMYAASEYKKPITNTILTNCILENNEVNFFDLQFNLYELVKRGEFYGFKEDGEYLYRLTEDGQADIDCFNFKIPLVIKKKIRDSVEKQLKSEKPITDVIADYTPHGKEFLASMKVLENGIEQFGVNVLVTNREIAKSVCVYLKNNAARLFSNINEEINSVFYTGKNE